MKGERVASMQGGVSLLVCAGSELGRCTWILDKITFNLDKVIFNLDKITFNLDRITFNLDKITFNLDRITCRFTLSVNLILSRYT